MLNYQRVSHYSKGVRSTFSFIIQSLGLEDPGWNMRTSWESCGFKFSGLEHHVPNFQIDLGKIPKISHFWWIPSDGQQLPTPPQGVTQPIEKWFFCGRTHRTEAHFQHFQHLKLEEMSSSNFSHHRTIERSAQLSQPLSDPIAATTATFQRDRWMTHCPIEKRHQDGASRGLTSRWMVSLEKAHGISKKGITWINVYVCLAYAYIYIYIHMYTLYTYIHIYTIYI